MRLTIPCVTGPYTNVSATLSLESSQIRRAPEPGTAELQDVPKSRTTTIATSTAQNDSGVFQLNFRDSKYMPFEGAGAISSWKLDLPKSFRQFDYNTINDVIVHISYTSEYDEAFRDEIEDLNSEIEGTLVQTLKNNALYRHFSLRQEFSSVFQRLLHSEQGSLVSLKIEEKHFPMFVAGRVKVNSAKLILVVPNGQTVNNDVNIQVNGDQQTGFASDATLGGLMTKELGTLFSGGIIREHQLSIVNPGNLGVDTVDELPGDQSAIDERKLKDIVLQLDYSLDLE